MKACSHEEGEDRKPSGGLDVCMRELSTSLSPKKAMDLCCYFRLPNTRMDDEHTYLGNISGFYLRALLGNK